MDYKIRPKNYGGCEDCSLTFPPFKNSSSWTRSATPTATASAPATPSRPSSAPTRSLPAARSSASTSSAPCSTPPITSCGATMLGRGCRTRRTMRAASSRRPITPHMWAPWPRSCYPRRGVPTFPRSLGSFRALRPRTCSTFPTTTRTSATGPGFPKTLATFSSCDSRSPPRSFWSCMMLTVPSIWGFKILMPRPPPSFLPPQPRPSPPRLTTKTKTRTTTSPPTNRATRRTMYLKCTRARPMTRKACRRKRGSTSPRRTRPLPTPYLRTPPFKSRPWRPARGPCTSSSRSTPIGRSAMRGFCRWYSPSPTPSAPSASSTTIST